MDAKLSIWTSYYWEKSFEEAIDELIKNGIFCAELSDEHGLELLERNEDIFATAKEISGFLKERNFTMTQGHLWLKIKICTDETAIGKLYKWIDMYEAMGVKNMVLHCDPMYGMGLTNDEIISENIKKMKIIADYVKDKEITICIENLRNKGDDGIYTFGSVEDLLAVTDGVKSERFGICLDTGHLNIASGNTHEDFIIKAGNKLRALHIADNQGETDQHLMPFNCGTVDFFRVVSALRKIDYKGLFNYEIPGERGVPHEMKAEKIKYIKAGYDLLMKEQNN